MPYLNREFSCRLIKFFLSFLDVDNGRLIGISFFRVTDQEFENAVALYDLRAVPDFAAIARAVASWKGILRALSNSVSRSRELPDDIHAWIDEEDAGRGPLRLVLEGFDDAEVVEERAVIPGVKELARRLLRAEDFIQIKGNIAHNLKIYQEEFSQSRDHVEDLADLVSLGSISKAEGNVRCTAVLNNLDRVVEAARQLFVLAPDGDVQQLIDI